MFSIILKLSRVQHIMLQQRINHWNYESRISKTQMIPEESSEVVNEKIFRTDAGVGWDDGYDIA